jgi:hypothetical protein
MGYYVLIARGMLLLFKAILVVAVSVVFNYVLVLYTGCPRRNVPEFGRVFLMLNYTDLNQNTCIQS